MKKLFTLVLCLCMALSCTAFAQEAESYALTEETFTLEQGPVWYFMYYDGETKTVNELHAMPSFGDNWQFSENPDADQVYHSICEWDGIQAMPGTWIGQPIDIVVKFVAPKAGTIEIAPMDFVIKDDGAEWPPYQVRIAKAGAAEGEAVNLFPAEGEWAETPATTEAITLDVTDGEAVYFVVRATDYGGAAVSVMPVISYK